MTYPPGGTACGQMMINHAVYQLDKTSHTGWKKVHQIVIQSKDTETEGW